MTFRTCTSTRVRALVRSALLALPLGALSVFAAPPQTPAPSRKAAQALPTVHPDGMPPEGFQVPKPPFTEGIFPCTSCHDGKSMKVNTQRRVLKDMHDDIVLNHGPESRWCLDCHDANKRDQLHLASGAPVSFTESYRLCGQCHGDKYRDWRVGVHGKRTGSWNGTKQYRLCVNCHNPHSPRFKALKPMPAPTDPTKIHARKGGAK